MSSPAFRRLWHQFQLLRAGLGPRWRRRFSEWAETNVSPALKSSEGEARLHHAVMKLAGRLAPILGRLNDGAAVLSDPSFARRLQSALSWIAYQEDITASASKLRAYCDVTASTTVLELLVREIAAEVHPGNAAGRLEVASSLAAASGDWREPRLVAGREHLRAGDFDAAITCARQALNIVSACPESQRLLIDALRERQRAGGAIDNAGRTALTDLRGRFCSRPFEVLVSSQSTRWNDESDLTEQVMGTTYLCDCAAWLPFGAGNVVDAGSSDEVWNSEGAQEIRRSILDGDYSYCSRTLCPIIANDALPRAQDVTSERLRRIIDNRETKVIDGPKVIALGHDSSCNLACPSCRVDLVMADKSQGEKLARARDRVILPMLSNRRVVLHLTSWGDPFASRHYRSILEALGDEMFEGVSLSLLTNGLGLTPHVWSAMPHLAGKIVELRVSVDAATKETYENVRRPGRWELLQENLGVIGTLGRAGTFEKNRSQGAGVWFGVDRVRDSVKPSSFALAFVVQRANFREMPAFVRLAEELGADVVFQKYYSFGHENPAAFAAKDVSSSSHPEHQELRMILQDPIMQSPRVTQVFTTQLLDAS